MEIKRVGVVGFGQMGAGIAQVAAAAGYEVVVRDVADEALERGTAKIDKVLSRSVEKGRISAEDKEATLARLRPTTELAPMAECQVVIEAIIEQMDAKCALWGELSGICPPETLFASNTSSLSVTTQAAASGRPEQFMGMHFFQPVPLMKLVELVRPLQASDATYEAIHRLAVEWRENVIVSKDRPGFIVNLLLIPYLNCAIDAYDSGVATKEDIDTGMRIGCAHPMGPLTLADFVGLDTCLFIADCLYAEFGDTKYQAPPLLRRMVSAGWLGRKSGRGFYEY